MIDEMTTGTRHGCHLIAGEWVPGAERFTSSPVTGPGHQVSIGTAADVDRAAQEAEAAFRSFGWSSRSVRALFLERIADEIEARADAITAIGTAETGLPEARLATERSRTIGQLRLFARVIRDGDYLDRRHDPADPERRPLPKPDLKLVQRPIGPVGVFGASNFPLAFSTAGGDTASALAAGCPVIVKGHPAHPGTGELVAEAILAAMQAEGLPAGVFQLVQSNSNEAGEALVTHPLIKAVGFTGSLGAGRALFDLACRRPEPIPFYGELGSINPQFILPAAMAARGEAIGRAWAASVTMGVGQFCTNPGVAVTLGGREAGAFEAAADRALGEAAAQPMLTEAMARAYCAGRDWAAERPGVRAVRRSEGSGRNAAPDLLAVDGATWLADPELHREVFGPFGVLVQARDLEEMQAIAEAIEGQLTCTLHMETGDTEAARRLVPVLERKAGRLIVNGFPTGVEVSPAMMHGGPYPACTFAGTTSVGTLAIRRFLRPVAYQDFPDALLPDDLREGDAG
jgi:2,5-dioxopentanoate dehydrogenase